MPRRVRSGGNGIVVVVGFVVALPMIVAAERIRAGGGRRVARRAVRLIAAVCGIRFVVDGAERITSISGRPCVLVPNHSSPVDIPALLVACPDARFVAAAELFRIPLLGSAMRALGCVPVDRRQRTRNAARLDVAVDMQGPVVVFADGGIPVPGEERRFETGAFVLAIETQAPVVPVTLRGSADVLPRGHRIWARPGTITVEVHHPIETADLTLADRKHLRDRTQQIVRGTPAG